MRIWKRILMFLAAFVLTLTVVCGPFRGSLSSWIATLRGGWNDRPYQLVAAGTGNLVSTARIQKDGALELRFFDSSEKNSLTKWEIELPEEAAEGELCLLYPMDDQEVFLGVYEENAQYLSLYRLHKDVAAERLTREQCDGNNILERKSSLAFSSVAQQQDDLYFTLLTTDMIRVLCYSSENGLEEQEGKERNGAPSAVALSDTLYRGEDGEMYLTYVGNGMFYLDTVNLKVCYADLSAETNDMVMVKLENYFEDRQLTSFSITEDGNALMLLDGHILLLVQNNGDQVLTDKLYPTQGACAVRVVALVAAALILSTLLYWLLLGRFHGRLPLAVYWGEVFFAMCVLVGVVLFLFMLFPLREETELMQRFELTDDIVDLALTERTMRDVGLDDILCQSLSDTNGLETRDLEVVQVHRDGGKWHLISESRAEVHPGVRMSCLRNAVDNNGVAVEKSADRFWYCMKQGEDGIFISYIWGKTEEATELAQIIQFGLVTELAAALLILILINYDLKKTARGLERYAGDQEWVKVRVSGGDELEVMASTLNSLAADRRDEERRRERIIKSYRRFVPEEILKLLGKQSVVDVDQHTIAARKMGVLNVSFWFPDPLYTNVDNTKLLFDSVNQVIERTAPIVRQKGGVVFNISYHGYDVVMENDARQVISTAVAVRQEVLALNQQRAENALPTVNLKIAADQGGVIMGIVGDQAQLGPSTMSDCFATHFKLIKLCEITEASILCTEAIAAGAEGYGSRYIGKCSAGNKAIRVYEVFDGDPYDVRKEKEIGLRWFSEGVLSLYSGELMKAKRIFLDLVRDAPLDGCARYYLYLADKLTEEDILDGLAMDKGMEQVFTDMTKNERTWVDDGKV